MGYEGADASKAQYYKNEEGDGVDIAGFQPLLQRNEHLTETETGIFGVALLPERFNQLVHHYIGISTWFFSRSSIVSRLRIRLALPSFTSTSAGFRRLLKLLDISKP